MIFSMIDVPPATANTMNGNAMLFLYNAIVTKSETQTAAQWKPSIRLPSLSLYINNLNVVMILKGPAS